MPNENVAVQARLSICARRGPVVIVRRAAVVQAAVGQLRADADNEYGPMLTDDLCFTLPWGKVRVGAMQVLRMDKGDFFGQFWLDDWLLGRFGLQIRLSLKRKRQDGFLPCLLDEGVIAPLPIQSDFPLEKHVELLLRFEAMGLPVVIDPAGKVFQASQIITKCSSKYAPE